MKTVDSVITQTSYSYIEYIIVDGGSTDGAKEWLETLNTGIKWISEQDAGISDAFNKGLALATGDYILMLNSGDTFLNSGVVENVIDDLELLKIDILSYKVKVEEGICIPSTNDVASIIRRCDFPHQGTFVSRRVYKEIGGYSQEYKVRMDFHFFAKCMKKEYGFKYIDKIIVNYEPGGTSMKKENRLRFWREGMSIKMLYGINLELKDYVKLILYK